MTELTVYNQISQKNVFSDLVSQHMGLVKKIAYHMSNRLPSTILLNDVIQSGMLGLMDAAKNYREDKGCSFETYASIRIRGSILDEIRKNDWIPRSVYKNSRAISQAIEAIEKRLNREARDEEVAKELNISIADYHKMLVDTNCCDLFSLDEFSIDTLNFINHNDDPCAQLQECNLKKNLTEQIKKLPEREQLILSLHLVEELNFKEIGKVLDISESRVCQIHSQAISRLRSRLCNNEEKL